jgi:hypothetical protein
MTAEETVRTGAGDFESFVLTYKLNDQTSKIWMVRNMPFPVKAATFDESDQPHYSFELLRVAGVDADEDRV